ncbi:MAG: class I SAM-dependent methyltransferase [Deltaproteobacteria bacterium]|nr:class I SAM-dependent methyltransferase [Deltaproteobacteria bacterium]
MISHEISCNLCGQRHFNILEEDQLPFKVLKCINCSLVFVYPQPEPVELKDHYEEGYYSEWIYTEKKKRLKMWSKRLNSLEKYKNGGMLLDVGCGEGTFLKLAQNSGWKISGTELSSYAAKYASNALGTDVFCGDLEDAKYPDHSFDVVTMWHVLEHVKDPKKYLLEVHRILKSNGLMVIAVPNVNDLVMQIAYRIIKRRKLKLFLKDEKELHLYHFSTGTIKSYLEKTGFDCLKRSPDFGIIASSKKLINVISVLPYYLIRLKIFNSIQIFATPKKG